MNTLATLASMVASGWLALFLYTTVSEALLGFAAFVLVVFHLPMLWLAVNQDRQIMTGRGGGEEE